MLALSGSQCLSSSQRAGQVCPVLARVFALLFSSLSLTVLTVTQSVRPSLSQLARFGLVAEFRKKKHKSSQQNFSSQHPLPCRSMFWSVIFVSARQIWISTKYFSSVNFPVSEQLKSRQRRGEERRGEGTVAFKSIWQTPGPSFHHLLITGKIFSGPDYWRIRMESIYWH